MSRGIGKTQRRILAELAATSQAALTVTDLAERIGVSSRQIGRAVHSLADRNWCCSPRRTAAGPGKAATAPAGGNAGWSMTPTAS